MVKGDGVRKREEKNLMSLKECYRKGNIHMGKKKNMKKKNLLVVVMRDYSTSRVVYALSQTGTVL